MSLSTLNGLLVGTLRDLYSVEQQLIKAIPRFVEAASSDELKSMLRNHLGQTEKQLERLEVCATSLQERLSGERSRAVDALVKEGVNLAEGKVNEWAADLGFIRIIDHIEHYEISAYEYARSLAEVLGEAEVVKLLHETLLEEQSAEQELTVLAHDMMDTILVEHSRDVSMQLHSGLREEAH